MTKKVRAWGVKYPNGGICRRTSGEKSIAKVFAETTEGKVIRVEIREVKSNAKAR